MSWDRTKEISKRWLPLTAWVVLIFTLSSLPSLPSSSSMPKGFDKAAHFVEYMVLALLFHRGLRFDSWRNGFLICCVVAATGMGVGALDEIYQSYVPGRDSSIVDLAADAAGSLTGALAAMLYYRRRASKGIRP